MQPVLLKGGIVLHHDDEDNVQVLRDTDVLVVDGRIADIGQGLLCADAVQEINCQNKIVSPGFVNAHHHLWQTQLKGRFGDDNFLDYMVSGNLQAYNFTSKDIFWGQLGGCLEALDSGTTCVVDNAHFSSGPEHGRAALDATIASGIRCIFCYGVSPLRASEWTDSSFELDMSDPLPAWLFSQLDEMTRHGPYGSQGQVQLGFFFDSYFIPRALLLKTFDKVRQMGVRVISSHFRHWPVSKGQSKIPEILDSEGLLAPDVLLAHGNGTTSEQASLLTSKGVYIATTPDTEVFMATGANPVAFREDLPMTCLGADCHSCGPSSMLHQMQVAIGTDRAEQVSTAFRDNQYPRNFRAKVQDAFNLATIRGARAIGMGDQIGSIAIGKQADLVVLDATTPAMTCAVDHDPLIAVVRHACVREVDTVLVGGQIRKLNGVLYDSCTSKPSMEIGDMGGKETVSWAEVAAKLSASRGELQQRVEGVNVELARRRVAELLMAMSKQ